jgi:ribosomal protein S18 acetylase RimI-like enzyme
MNIRTANLTDIEKIMFLENQVFELHSKARPDWIGKNPTNYDHIKSIIESNNGKIFIAEENGMLIGHCLINVREIKNHHMFHDMKNIEIEDLCIDEKYRKKGIGKKLFEEVKIYAKENGINIIELSVWEFNENAKKFYENMGMKTRINRMEYKIEK